MTDKDSQDRDYSGMKFYNEDLRGKDFSFCNLFNCDFVGADLRGVDFHEANLECADLGYARFDEHTRLPDGTVWSENVDLDHFTDPHHPDYWRSTDKDSPAYEI